MSNLFMNVKAAVTARQAAEYYGFPVDRHGMMCCPFHNDKHPSMKVDVRYYCFGCQEHGDVIDFVSKVFGVSPYEAAKKLAQDFGIDPGNDSVIAVHEGYHAWQQQKMEGHCAAVLINYELLLRRWFLRYAPSAPSEPVHKRFVMACMKLPAVSDCVDMLYSPDEKLRKSIAEGLMKDGTINKVEAFLKKYSEEVEDAQFNALNAAAA